MDELESSPDPIRAIGGRGSSIIKSISSKYAYLLVSYPRGVAFLVVCFITVTLIISIWFSNIPQLNDPSREFITIGTFTASKINRLNALMHNTVPFPSFGRSARRKRSLKSQGGPQQLCFEYPDQQSSELWTRFASMGKLVISSERQEEMGSFLTSSLAIKDLCILQRRVERLPAYRRLCSRVNLMDANSDCCSIWSLPTFIASITGKNACEEITQEDVILVRHLQETCNDAFISGSLKRSCWDDTRATPPQWLCPDVPVVCFLHPNLLLLLAISEPNIAQTVAHSTLFVLPVWRQMGLEFLQSSSLDHPSFLTRLTSNLSVPMSITALDLGVYDELSTHYLIADSVWLALGAGLLTALLLLLTHGSLLVAGATLAALVWSLVVAYCLYSRVLRIATFPLINAMTIVLLLGLGADDILLFFQVWMSTAAIDPVQPNDPGSPPSLALDTEAPKPSSDALKRRKARRLATCLRHAVPSVCLTSVATVGGLLASLASSKIVAVQRFAAFSTISVACHVLYVLLVMPSLVLFLRTPPPSSRSCCSRWLSGVSRWFSRLVVHLRYVFPCILVVTIVGSSTLLFHFGWLNFPSSGSLQTSFYKDNHPLEVYRSRGADVSWAEAKLRQYKGMVTVNMVWTGVGALTDTRNPWTWTPDDMPSYGDDDLQFDPAFRLTVNESVAWMRDFCARLQNMPRRFVPSGAPIQKHQKGYLEEGYLFPYYNEPWCPFGHGLFSLDNYMKSIDCLSVPLSACCASGTLAKCIAAYARQSPVSTGLRYFANSTETVSLVITVTSSLSLYNATLSDLMSYAKELESWFSDLISTAPPSLSNGFLVSPELAAFDAYADVLRFLPLSLGLSISLAAVLVFLSTLNVLLSLTAFLSVAAALLLSCLLLVLVDNWTLGVVEALILSLAAGLSVDPCLHLAFAINRPLMGSDTTESWPDRCRVALETVGCAVTGAVLTTAIAGSAVLPSRLKCYHQMGVFLLILMACSWIFCGVSFVACVACFPRNLSTCWLQRGRIINAN